MRYVVLDTETTGLDPDQGHRVVEIGCVEVANRQLTGRHFHTYLNPERDIDPGAEAVHGLSRDFLETHPIFAHQAQDFLDFVRGANVIIHNAAFDVKFLNAELARLGLAAFSEYCQEVIDTLAQARELHPGKRNSLDALCDRYGIANAHRTLHGALLDAELLADVWLAMTRGQNSLMIDPHDGHQQTGTQAVAKVDGFDIPVLYATPDEIAAHETYLDRLDQDAKKNSSLWRQLAGPGPQP